VFRSVCGLVSRFDSSYILMQYVLIVGGSCHLADWGDIFGATCRKHKCCQLCILFHVCRVCSEVSYVSRFSLSCLFWLLHLCLSFACVRGLYFFMQKVDCELMDELSLPSIALFVEWNPCHLVHIEKSMGL